MTILYVFLKLFLVCVLPQSDPCQGFPVYFPTLMKITFFQPPTPFSPSGVDHVIWYGPSPCLHAYTTCIIPYKMFGYAGSITNHNPWDRYQWFITLATYWSHCDITVMHVRFISPLSFSFVKNSTETTSVPRPQVNIL